MYLKTKVIKKHITMSLALVGCVSLGLAQNNELKSTKKTSENKLVKTEKSRVSLSTIDKENVKPTNAKAQEAKMSSPKKDYKLVLKPEVIKEDVNKEREQIEKDENEGEPEASIATSDIYVFSKRKLITPQVVEITTVFEFLNNSEDHTFLVRAIKAAGLEDALSAKGRFTVFAPNNAAFNALGEEVLETLFEAENRETLKGILSYHVMPGNQGVNELTRAINGNGGQASLKTLNGATLTATLNGDKVVLIGGNGEKATIISGDKAQSNGIVHTINTVVMPN